MKGKLFLALLMTIASSLALAAGTDTTATDDTETMQRTARFTDLDIDGDGYISAVEGEADEDLNADWSELDTNADMQLDENEFAQYQIQPGRGGDTTGGTTNLRSGDTGSGAIGQDGDTGTSTVN